MTVEKGDERRGGRLGWLSLLFAQVFSDRTLISSGSYCAGNALVGSILLLIAVILLVDPERGSVMGALALGSVGLVLAAGLVVMIVRGMAMRWLLAIQGTLLVLLAVFFTIGSVDWALRAPPMSSFRYAPGLALFPLTYGMLQVAAFGPWPGQAKWLRTAGMLAGIVCELSVAACLLLRAFRT